MFATELRRAVEAAPRAILPDITQTLWKAFAAGQVTEAEAEDLAALIEAKKAVGGSSAPVRRSVGSRPRSPASLERRRRWAACGVVPGHIAARFTTAEVAVLSVVATEASKTGDCRWTIGQIAAVSGVSETTVKRTIREAKAQGLISVEERRVTAWRNASNIVRIVGTDWISWLRLSKRRGGGRLAEPEGRSGAWASRSRFSLFRMKRHSATTTGTRCKTS